MSPRASQRTSTNPIVRPIAGAARFTRGVGASAYMPSTITTIATSSIFEGGRIFDPSGGQVQHAGEREEEHAHDRDRHELLPAEEIELEHEDAED